MSNVVPGSRRGSPRKHNQRPEFSIWHAERAGDASPDDEINSRVDAMAWVAKCDRGWHLDIVFASGVSIVWDEPFPTQQDALRMLEQFCEETRAVEIQMR
jgi:hypothetical protein